MSMKSIAAQAFIVIALATLVDAQVETASRDPWIPVRSLEGLWEGEGKGFGQISKLTHKWEFVLDGNFFRLETQSVIATESGSDKIHQDVGYVSWSEGEGILRFRQFLSEGFVNTFTLEEVVGPQRGLNFEPVETEGMETMSARMTLRFLDTETYEMVLELGTKGKELKPCQTMKLRRVN
jgi:hypothetical protein